MSYYTIKGIVRNGLPILAVTSMIGIMAGQILNFEIERLVSTPTLLILIPALIKIGGDTGSMLGARLSSAFHMGLGSHLRKNPVVRNSVLAALIVGYTALFALSIIVSLVSWLMDIHIGFLTLLKICFIAGTIELVIVFSATIATAFASHRFGIDPDDTVIPLIATLGDFVGIMGILATFHILDMI